MLQREDGGRAIRSDGIKSETVIVITESTNILGWRDESTRCHDGGKGKGDSRRKRTDGIIFIG